MSVPGVAAGPLAGPPLIAQMRRAAQAALAVLVLGLGAWSVGHEVGTRPVRAVRITGPFRHVARERLEAAIAEEVARGFFALDVAALRGAARALPWVRDVEVRRIWPDGLDLRVSERLAVARWNAAALLDVDGTAFRPAEPALIDGVPRLEGPPGSERRVLDRLREVEAGLGALGGKVRRLALEARGAWVAELAGGTRVLLGREGDGGDALAALAGAGAVLGERIGQVERIDLRYPNGFAVRWRTAEGPGPEGSQP